MHASLYQLKLELYANPPQNTTATTSGTVFTPPCDADIFTAAFPVHRATPWTRDFLNKRTKGGNSVDHSPRTPELRPTSAGQASEQKLGTGDALLLPERNTALREISANIPSSPTPSPKHASKDWRFGPVSIDRIDMEPQRASPGDTKNEVVKSQSGSTTHTRGLYVPSDTKTTDVGWGVVHLYKDSQDVSQSKHAAVKSSDSDFDLDKCTTLCILAVPSWMMPSDLLGFVGDQTREDVSHFRLIRTGRANKYMVLMKFRSPKKARDWQDAWNGRLFSAMEVRVSYLQLVNNMY